MILRNPNLIHDYDFNSLRNFFPAHRTWLGCLSTLCRGDSHRNSNILIFLLILIFNIIIHISIILTNSALISPSTLLSIYCN